LLRSHVVNLPNGAVLGVCEPKLARPNLRRPVLPL